MSAAEEKNAKPQAPAKVKKPWIYSIVLLSRHRENEKGRDEVVYVGLDLDDAKAVFHQITSRDFGDLNEWKPETKYIIRSRSGKFFGEGACNERAVVLENVADDNQPRGYCNVYDERELSEEDEDD